VLDEGYADAFRARHPREAGFTFPSWSPHVRLDYAFVPGNHLDRVTSCQVVSTPDSTRASDHLALMSEIDIAGD